MTCQIRTLTSLHPPLLTVSLVTILHDLQWTCNGLFLQVDIKISPGAHSTEDAVNKQLNDKERVAAALENPNLYDMVKKCLRSTEDRPLH